MKMKILNTLVILALVLSLPVIATRSAYSTGGVVVKEPIAIGAMARSGDHLVMPRDEIIISELQKDGVITFKSTDRDVQAAIQKYKQAFAKKSDTWVNAEMEEKALAREDQLASASPMAPQAIQPVEISIFTLAVDFEDEDETVYYDDVYSADGCNNDIIINDTFAGPLVGNIPYPDPKDNNTLWYDPNLYSGEGSPAWYNNLIYGYAGVGRIRANERGVEPDEDVLVDPRDGLDGINLAGYTVQDYYDHQAGEDNVTLYGDSYGWVTVDHPEAYYGADNCNGSHYGGAYTFDGENYTEVPVSTLVLDAVTKFNEDNPGFYWPDFDMNEDGLVDTFWIIYAGVGQEAGGGAQGDFALWSHSSDTRYYFGGGAGILVYDGGTADLSDDIYVGPYTMQPETADVGVMTEEFGHNVFGLPDLYVTDTQGSIAFWATMESGSWGGYLGGSTPVGMPLWFKMIAWCGIGPCNWQSPMLIREYDDPPEEVEIAQLEKQYYDGGRPDWGPSTPTDTGMFTGVRINLPKALEEVPNNAGTGKAAWSSTGNDAYLTLGRTIAVPAGSDILLQVASYWDIEEDYDYGYFEVDAGSGWEILPDVAGNCSTGPFGCGLTGAGSDLLQYDLTAYAGTTVDIRFSYVTDPFVNGAGWWLDNLTLDGVLIDDFETASLPDTFPGWSNNGWAVTPFSETHNQYYLVEWRNDTKYDQMVRTAYVTTDSGDNLWRVERVPYNIPGALVYYRNTGYSGTYAQTPNYTDPPSFGPKYQLLLVDMNYMPVPVGSWGETGYFFNDRVGSFDAALTLNPTDYWELSKVNGIDPSTYPGPFEYYPEAPVTQFNDAQPYYSGYAADEGSGAIYDYYRHDSAVIPARDRYSAGMWDYNTGDLPWWWFYEFTWEKFYGYSDPEGTSWIGNGAPGYDNVQYGVNISLEEQGADGEYGVLWFYNHSVDFPTTVSGGVDGLNYVLTTETEVTNQGPRQVYELDLVQELDSDVCDDSAYIESHAVSSLGGELPVDIYDYGYYAVEWYSPDEGLAPDETITVTTTCTIPMELVGNWDFETETWVDAYDGQISRGYWVFWYDEEVIRYTLPLILSGN
jgi:immune inhibitor A